MIKIDKVICDYLNLLIAVSIRFEKDLNLRLL